MRKQYFVLAAAIIGGLFFLIFVPNQFEVRPVPGATPGVKPLPAALSTPEAVRPTSSRPAARQLVSDIEKQQPLQISPKVVKGIYVTAWSAGSPARINALIDFVKRTELNAVVIDIKDFSGNVSYKTGIPEVAASGAEGELRIFQPNALIKKLHDAGIYVIARQTVFQDPILAKAHPEWALKNASTGKVWTDNKGLSWMDAAAAPVWDYNILIAKDAFSRGFDEVNFDYVRFASDGDLGKLQYPFWDKKTPRYVIVGKFFKYLKDNLPGKTISVDLFGLSTIDTWDDLGIGQVIEDAYKNFDYVSPMVYPSHYASGFMGYKQPAKYPYEVVNYSMEKALSRLEALILARKITETTSTASASAGSSEINEPVESNKAAENVPRLAKLRPWLQDFDLGAVYDAEKVRAQIQATYDALINASSSSGGEYYGGWLLWDPANTYTEGALERK